MNLDHGTNAFELIRFASVADLPADLLELAWAAKNAEDLFYGLQDTSADRTELDAAGAEYNATYDAVWNWFVSRQRGPDGEREGLNDEIRWILNGLEG